MLDFSLLPPVSEQGWGEIGDRGHFRDVLENHRSILRPMLMPWCDICILETSPRYVEYLLDITARMHAEQTFRGRGRNRRNKWKLECRTERWEVERRIGTCYCTMKNSSTCFNRRVFVLVRVSCIEHKGISQLVRRELKIRVDVDGGAIGVTRSPCPYPRPCVHVCIVLCNNRVSVSSWEKSVIDSLRKAIYFSDHLPKAKGAGSFDPALRDRFFEMTPPIKDIRKRSFTIFRFEYDYFRSI